MRDFAHPRPLRGIEGADERDAWLIHSKRPLEFQSPCEGREFALLLVVGADDVTPGEQEALSQSIVHAGCRYAVCWGHACSSWDDSIDTVRVLGEIEGQAGPVVMTSWHEGEPLEEVAEFFVRDTGFDDWVPRDFVALVVGGSSELVERTHAAVAAALRMERG